ncbi:minichromosome maintenance protein MCM [Candidatus Micrarchaeota archaeon]|nr:minichromosome maintenance protein MCM [Candidatus Micrarchaeota archaeon]
MDKDVDIRPIVDVFQNLYTTVYKEDISRLVANYPNIKSIHVDYNDLNRFSPETADLLIEEPELVIKAAEKALLELNLVVLPGMEFRPHVRFTNLPDTGLMIERLSSKHIGKLVNFKGVITKRGEIIHKVRVAVYRCELCDTVYRVELDENTKPPTVCERCKRRSLRLVEDECEFIDMQRGEVQELLERVKGGTPPARVELVFKDDLVNSVIPGDTVEIVGIMKLRESKASRKGNKLVYTRYIEVNNVRKLQREFEELEISDEEEQRIKEFAKDPKVFEKIVESIAPGIYGHEEIKKAIALQLFGGTKDKTMPGGVPIRDDIHLLLIGDPGAAKTKLLQYVAQLAPKGIYVSGKSVSGVGLTASAERDELSEGGWTLKAGALVLASGGIATIDEFDKISNEDRSALHEAMESQTISIAKAGIVARLKAKTAILAAANPRYGRFDPNKPPVEQFDIPPTLMSRFDLIFPIMDVIDEKRDSELADRILRTHRTFDLPDRERVDVKTELLDREFLRKYIAYARQHIRPQLTPEAESRIKEYYIELRKLGKSTHTVPITPRQIEAIIRMAEASAKLHLRDKVEVSDAELAISLVDFMLKRICVDKETGSIDIDTTMTGTPKSQRDKLTTIFDIIRDIQRLYEDVEINKVVEMAKEYNIDEHTVRKVIEQLLMQGDLYKPKPGHVRLVEPV